GAGMRAPEAVGAVGVRPAGRAAAGPRPRGGGRRGRRGGLEGRPVAGPADAGPAPAPALAAERPADPAGGLRAFGGGIPALGPPPLRLPGPGPGGGLPGRRRLPAARPGAGRRAGPARRRARLLPGGAPAALGAAPPPAA